MAPTFFDLPFEIRLEVYKLLFRPAKVILAAKDEDDSCSMVPKSATFQHQSSKSSQLLRVNRTILQEARPILYANTTIHVVSRAFAGKLPTRWTDGQHLAPHIKHLIWQMDCDMLKHFYAEDHRLDLEVISGLSSLEIRCRVDTWRNSFLGEWCDREAFVKGRAHLIEYARVFQDAMSSGLGHRVDLEEDRSQLGRGRIVLRLQRHRARRSSERKAGGDSLIIARS